MSDDYAVPDAELKPWERFLRHQLERRPSVIAKVDAAMESKECEERLTLLLVTSLYALLFTGSATLFAIIFTVLALTLGHPWEGPATSLWVVAVITVAMVHSGYRTDKEAMEARLANDESAPAG